MDPFTQMIMGGTGEGRNYFPAAPAPPRQGLASLISAMFNSQNFGTLAPREVQQPMNAGGMGMNQQPGFLGRLQQWNEANPGVLASIGAGMVRGDTAAGFEQAAKYRALAQAQQKEDAKLERSNVLTRNWLINKKGLSDADADAALANPMVLQDLMKDPQEPEYMSAGDGYIFNKSDGTFIQSPGAKQPQNDYDVRRQQAEQSGMSPDDPRYQSFILTGKMPREDAQALTATDKRAILEADEMVQTADSTLPLLTQALGLNNQAYEGATAGARGWLAGNLGIEGGEKTMEFDNLIQQQALSSLKATFGAAPTEGERKILLEIAGSSNQPASVRKGILERAIRLVENRRRFYDQRASEMRGGDFYKPATAQGAAPAQAGGGGRMRFDENGNPL